MQRPVVTDEQIESAIERIRCPKCGAVSDPDPNLTRVGRFYTYRRYYGVAGTFRGVLIEEDDSNDEIDQPDLMGYSCFECQHDWKVGTRVKSGSYHTVRTALFNEASLRALDVTHLPVERAEARDLHQDDVLLMGDDVTAMSIVVLTQPPSTLEGQIVLQCVGLYEPSDAPRRTYRHPPTELITLRRPKGPPSCLAQDLVAFLVRLTGPNALVGMDRFAEAGIRTEMARHFTAVSVDLFFAGFLVHRELRWHLLVPADRPVGRPIDL